MDSSSSSVVSFAKEVNGFGLDFRGNINRKDRRKGGLVKDAPRLLAYGW